MKAVSLKIEFEQLLSIAKQCNKEEKMQLLEVIGEDT